MWITKIKTFANIWLQWYEITIEADMNNSLPSIEIIGLPDTTIKESKERIRSTFRNCEIPLPNKRIVLNLAPSDTKKVWTSFDLPMAVAILTLTEAIPTQISDQIENYIFFGELGLDWSVKRINWLLPSVISAIESWYKQFFIPEWNIYELEYIPNIEITPLTNFSQIIDFLLYQKNIKTINKHKSIENIQNTQTPSTDFAHIKWQIIAKRAATIAAAWFHNILLVGAPWSWKTLLSKALHSVLPPMSFEEMLEVSKIYSITGHLNEKTPLITQRPFRQIHHTASKIAITWWWKLLNPWEISLAHKWILFFDELTEFPRETIEVLRQPMEDKTIIISRVSGSLEYPANFMFIASMNPCKCWYYQDKQKECICRFNEIQKYQSKISGPLLDRIDIILEVPRENFDKIFSNLEEESSETLKKKVLTARQIQQKRFSKTKINFNSELNSKLLYQFISINEEQKKLLKTASQNLNLSGRVLHRILKIARTIADIENSEEILTQHIAEALQYRNKSMFINQ